MSLQSITQLKIDFYDKKYITINAKQHDKNSRFISVTCYNRGELFPINASEHVAYIRYKKSDEYSVFNFCEISRKGEILVELTEQMLACDGICFADLVIVNKGDANVDVETGEIIAIENAPIISTMTFCIDVSETAIGNSNIESTYEFNLLNSGLEAYWADFEEVMKTSKSYAIGNSGIRDGENTDNAKYYYEQSLMNASNAKDSENAAANSASAASISETNAKTSETNAKISETNAYNSASAALGSEQKAKASETAASTSEQNAKRSETNAKASETNAKVSESNAKTSEVNSAKSETNALDSANKAQSYAIGGTGTRNNEDNDNAYYYYELTKNIVIGLDSGFIPMGTITFAELATVEKATGYVYNISDDFVTDERFHEGIGKSYTAGVNVYCCYDGMLDCFGGISSPTATVDETRNYLGI